MDAELFNDQRAHERAQRDTQLEDSEAAPLMGCTNLRFGFVPGVTHEGVEESKARSLPTKIPQKHGSALYSGGVPGHNGSRAGRRRSEVKELLLAGAADAVPVLMSQLVADDPTIAQGAANKLLKYGVGTPREESLPIEEIRDRLRRTIEAIRRLISYDVADRHLNEMREIWK